MRISDWSSDVCSSDLLVAAIDVAPADMATGTLADWLVALEKTPGVRNAPALRAAAEAELRKRLVYEGTRLDLVDDARAPWWMMASGDEMAIKTLDAVLGSKGWEEDAGRLLTGVAQRQRPGHSAPHPAHARSEDSRVGEEGVMSCLVTWG